MDTQLEVLTKTESQFETRYCRTCGRDTEHVRVDARVSHTKRDEHYCMECQTKVVEISR
jgi:hypothetical protein